MAKAIHRIKSFRRLIQPRHTAYKTTRDFIALLYSEKVQAAERFYPSQYKGYISLRELLDVTTNQAADFACKHEIGRLFYAAGPLARCRSPPFSRFPQKS